MPGLSPVHHVEPVENTTAATAHDVSNVSIQNATMMRDAFIRCARDLAEDAKDLIGRYILSLDGKHDGGDPGAASKAERLLHASRELSSFATHHNPEESAVDYAKAIRFMDTFRRTGTDMANISGVEKEATLQLWRGDHYVNTGVTASYLSRFILN